MAILQSDNSVTIITNIIYYYILSHIYIKLTSILVTDLLTKCNISIILCI